jgi:Phosphodiester glycosidase
MGPSAPRKPARPPKVIPSCEMSSPRATADASGSLRWEMPGGDATTVHVARYDRLKTRVGVASLPMQPLASWCRNEGRDDAIVGGFFIRAAGTPLGDLWIDGKRHASEPFTPPYGEVRACVHSTCGTISIAARNQIPASPEGDLLQAGPLLVVAGRIAVTDGVDPEGFSSACSQFDSDITVGRYPRAAVGSNGAELIAVACDGRSDRDTGMTLGEMALLMRDLGADSAINLDGGGSASLVVGGTLRNEPREEHGVALVGGRPVSTALTFMPA